MHRRGFIGSMIGSVVSLPFFARLVDEPFQRVILPYRMLFKDSISGYMLQTPGIARIVKEPLGFAWVAETFDSKTTLRIESIVLLTADGKVIGQQNTKPIHLINGDSLNVKYSLMLDDCPDITPEELVDINLIKNKRKPRFF